MPAGSEGKYFVARLRGGDVAAVGSIPESAPPTATWNTYVWVDNADVTAAKVVDAGGSVLMEPFDVGDAGRMAVFADPEGALFCVWQAKTHKGARIVNEQGSLNFNDLHAFDVDGAKSFYGCRVRLGDASARTAGSRSGSLPGYGDYLERDDPDLRKRVAEVGGPTGFEDVVGEHQPDRGRSAGHPRALERHVRGRRRRRHREEGN